MSYRLLIATALTATVFTTSVQARNTVIGLSPNQAPETLKAQVERSVLHLAETLKPGEKAHFFDASKAQIIASFIVPDKQSYDNPRAKLQVNKKAIGALKRFIDTAKAVSGKDGILDLPAFLRTVRQNYPFEAGADLIILGSPVHDNPKASSLSMLHGRVPNDGHVTSHSRSLYGTKGLKGSLEGYDVYFGVVDQNWAVSVDHAFYTERFWTLSVEGHGGSMAYFGDDLQTLFSLAGKDQPEHRHSDRLAETDKLEMLQFAPDNATVPDIYAQPLEEEPVANTVLLDASNIQIGITWDEIDVDLDLYVRAKPSVSAIFFGNPNTAEGRLFKDFVASPKTGFETVALNGRFDLRDLRIAVNFYGGSARKGKVNGELRLAINGKVWALPFTFDRKRGNGQKGVDIAMTQNIAPNDAWLIFDPLKITGSKQ